MAQLYRVGTFVAAWVGSLMGLFLVLPLGLIVVEWLIFPLALLIAALLAALGAGWAGTYLARDQTQTLLLPVISSTVEAAMGLALIFLLSVWVGLTSFGPLIVPVLFFSLVLALIATFATWRFRSPQQNRRTAVRLTVTVLVLAVVSVSGIVFLASLLGLAGA
jgi:hypothetical protein